MFSMYRPSSGIANPRSINLGKPAGAFWVARTRRPKLAVAGHQYPPLAGIRPKRAGRFTLLVA